MLVLTIREHQIVKIGELKLSWAKNKRGQNPVKLIFEGPRDILILKTDETFKREKQNEQ